MNTTSTASLQSDSGTDCGCGCAGACGCSCVPAEFTRLRYAYGLRLGAVELSDEQSYLVGKHRFHNIRCHGAGVLCGLRVDPFQFPQGSTSTSSTVLRVTRGAALDTCGREVLVPVDQCIDVNAWFLNHSAKLSLPSGTTTVPMRVALRYRECPSDPAPVPRDPCGCDASGCDYTRVHEGFELRLFAGTTLPECADDVFPDAADLLNVLGVSVPVSTPRPTTKPAPAPSSAVKPAADTKPVTSSPKVSHLVRKLDELTAACCPATKNEWICLADFTATLDSAGATVTTISAPDNAIPGRHVLLSTAALQTLILGLAGVVGAEGFLGVGPTLGGISFASATSTPGTLNIAVNLITKSGSPTPLANFDPTFLRVFQFSANKWTNVTPTAPNSVSLSTDSTQISVNLSGLAAGQQFRVSLISPEANPIVDTLLRPLRPMNYSVSFQLGTDQSGKLTIVPLNV